MVSIPSSDIQEKLRRLDILEPIDPEVRSKWHTAPRLSGLHGKVGGFLANRKANADILLLNVKELLDKQFELQDSMVISKFIYSRPAADDIVDALAARCDFVVTAIAD